MNELLPIVAELADARTHVARAEWLLCCPIDILRRYETTICNRLVHAGCNGGLSYLQDLRTVLSRTRCPDTGLFDPAATEIMFLSGQRLLAWAANTDAYNATSATDL